MFITKIYNRQCPCQINATIERDLARTLSIIYPAMTAFTDQYSLPNNFFDIGQL
jgi:hypothetical protein